MKRLNRVWCALLVWSVVLLCSGCSVPYVYPQTQSTASPASTPSQDPNTHEQLVMGLLTKANITTPEGFLSLFHGRGWRFARSITHVEMAVSAMSILNGLTGLSMYSQQQVSTMVFHVYGKKLDHAEVAAALAMQPWEGYAYQPDENMYECTAPQQSGYQYIVQNLRSSGKQHTMRGDLRCGDLRCGDLKTKEGAFVFRVTLKENKNSALGYVLTAYNDSLAQDSTWEELDEDQNQWQGLFFAVNDQSAAGLEDLVIADKVKYGCGREEAAWWLGEVYLTQAQPETGMVQQEIWFFENMTPEQLQNAQQGLETTENHGMALIFQRQPDELVILTEAYITSGTFKTARDLRVGDTADKLIAAYRNDSSEKGISLHMMYGDINGNQPYGIAEWPDSAGRVIRVTYVLEGSGRIEYTLEQGVIRSIHWSKQPV